MARRLLSLFCCALVVFTIAACDASKSTQNMLDIGIQSFGEGRSEENYYFKGSGALLDELIDKYSGSYYRPTGTSMTDDEHDDAKKAQEDAQDDTDPSGTDPSDGGGSTQPSDGATIPKVSSLTDVMRVFHKAYDDTAEYVEFKTVGGYQFDIDHDLQTIYTQLQREDPIDVSGVASWSTWSSGAEFYVSIEYSYEIDELKRIKKETTKLVDDAVNRIGADGRSDYEIVYAVNEYLCDTVYYPESEPYEPITHTAYGALKNGCAVCEGYACAAKLLLNKMGVECDIEIGTCSNGEGHAWNLVKLDQAWYQLDVTWNDASISRSDYFLVTDDYMKQTRTWEESDYPVCARVPYKP